MCSDCTSPTPEAQIGFEPDLVELLDHAAGDYRHLESPMGPIVPDPKVCRAMDEMLTAVAKRIRDEYDFQQGEANRGNEYSQCVLQVLDRIVGGT